MTRRSPRFLADRSGASAVEFSIVAWPFLLLVLGLFEFGRLLWTREALQESAMAGARCMGVLQSSCAASGAYSSSKTTSYIQSVASGWSITVPSSDIALTNSTSCGGVSGFSQVSISYDFQTVVPGVMSAIGSKTLNVSACFPNQS